jgi:hypothetical protein
MCSDNLIPRLPNTAHSCGRDGPATTWLTSERPGETLYLFQKYLLYWKNEYIVPRNKIATVQVTFYVLFYNLFVLKNFWRPAWLRRLNETTQFCQFYDNVFETDWKCLELHALCFLPDQLTPSPPDCQGSSYPRRIVAFSHRRSAIAGTALLSDKIKGTACWTVPTNLAVGCPYVLLVIFE